MSQQEMIGSDWAYKPSPREQRKNEAARKKAGIEAAKKLHAAADALSHFAICCGICDDASSPRGADDGRYLLAQQCREYAGWLESKYERGDA